MVLDETSLLELKKLVTLGQNNYRYFENAGVAIVALEALFQTVKEKEASVATLDAEMGKLNNSLLSAKGKLKEAQDDAKAILAGAHEEYDSIIAKAKELAEKTKASATEKADKEYAKASADRIKVEAAITESKEILVTLSTDIEVKAQELRLIEEKLATVKEQIARLAGA